MHSIKPWREERKRDKKRNKVRKERKGRGEGGRKERKEGGRECRRNEKENELHPFSVYSIGINVVYFVCVCLFMKCYSLSQWMNRGQN